VRSFLIFVLRHFAATFLSTPFSPAFVSSARSAVAGSPELGHSTCNVTDPFELAFANTAAVTPEYREEGKAAHGAGREV
jgi:hypothetical protein